MYDIAVIGGGVVGCAMARRFAMEGARVVLLEKARDILDGASKANSAILHTGFDAPAGSVELACIQAGYREYMEIHDRLGLPVDRAGAYVVAWDADQEAALERIAEKGRANGVELALIGGAALRRAEPGLSEAARAAVQVPGEALIDPWSAPYAYLRQALENGAEVRRETEVTGGARGADGWHLETSRGGLRARWVINCAGLYGDLVERAVGRDPGFRITPRKGQFVVYDKAASSLIKAVILPVPTARTKGIVLFRTIFGNLAVGPTAEDQHSRTDAGTDGETLRALMAEGARMLPALENMPVTATYAGLRPATEFKDYQIRLDAQAGWITVGGIRSTGLSAALGIAAHVWGLYAEAGGAHVPPVPVLWPERRPPLAQEAARDWRLPGNGGIVCHCELVTRREVELALQGPLAAGSLAGLKRQTRVSMGRCQGFNCMARLARLGLGRFEPPLAAPIRDGDEGPR